MSLDDLLSDTDLIGDIQELMLGKCHLPVGLCAHDTSALPTVMHFRGL